MHGTFVLGFLAVFMVVASAQKSTPEFKCLGEKVDFSEKDAVVKQCREELKDKMPADADSSSKASKGMHRCFETCGFRKLGFVTSDDKLDITVINAFIDKSIPESARAAVKTDIKKCADKMTDKLSDDDNCKNHAPYQSCVIKSYMKNCS